MLKKNAFYFLVIFLAGFSFLVFEVSWFRMLSLSIGATISASTIVLAAFMAGLGLGAYFWGKRANEYENSRPLLVLLFTAIAVLGIADFYLIKHVIPNLYSFLSNAMVIIIAFKTVFISAFFMGGIIPLIAKTVINNKSQFSPLMGKVYAFETLGSALGGLSAGFYLIAMFGQKQVIFIAAGINLLLAILIFLNKKSLSSNENRTIEKEIAQGSKKTEHSSFSKKTAVFSIFISGFAVSALQIIWMRFFKVYLTNTNYTFALISSIVVLGLFLGSWVYSKKSHKIIHPESVMIKQLMYLALFSFIGLVVLLNLHTLILFPLIDWYNYNYVRIIIVPILSSLIIVLPVSYISGYIFPHAISMFNEKSNDVSSNVGKMLLINTLGATIGPLVAAFILIPLIGASLSLLIILLSIIIVIFIISRNKTLGKKMAYIPWVSGFIIVFIVMIVIARPKFPTLPPSFNKYQKQILAYNETLEGTYVVGKETTPEGGVVLSTYVNNSSVIGSTYDAIKVVKMVGHLPFFSGLHCKKALIVGFGIGVTTSAIGSHPEVEQMDCVELVSRLKKAAKYYNDINFGIENDKRLTIYSGDGRHFLQNTRNTYDLISSDPTHPILGSSSLYTQEYFSLCKEKLNKGGMVSQYLPLHKLTLESFLGIIKTFYSVFPNATVWIGHYHAVLLGTKGNSNIDFEKWSQKIEQQGKDMYFYNNPYHLAACLVFDSVQVKSFPKNIEINTDNKSYTEFFDLESMNNENLWNNLKWVNNNRGGVTRIFKNIKDTTQLQHFMEGNKLLTESVYYYLQNNYSRYIEILQKACIINPEDEEYPFLIKFHYATR